MENELTVAFVLKTDLSVTQVPRTLIVKYYTFIIYMFSFEVILESCIWMNRISLMRTAGKINVYFDWRKAVMLVLSY